MMSIVEKSRVVTMDKITALCKRRGFVFPGSDIYGGLANTWDYGPLGVELKRNVKDLWWRRVRASTPGHRRPRCRHSDAPARLGGVWAHREFQ